jgi:hypothetical protein
VDFTLLVRAVALSEPVLIGAGSLPPPLEYTLGCTAFSGCSRR